MLDFAPVKISPEQLLHVATLARLDLDPEEQEQLAADLGSILEYVNKLAELDTSGVEPTAQVIKGGQRWREDKVTSWSDPDRLLENAPERDGKHFKVPRIIE